MTNLEIRQTMNETVAAWRASWGDTRRSLSSIIVRGFEKYRWLGDQIPYEVLHTAYLQHSNGAVRLPQAFGDWCLSDGEVRS